MNLDQWPGKYEAFPGLKITRGRNALRPISWSDRTPIRRWRNEQISVLRQREPLSAHDQDQYFAEVIAPQMKSPQPPQLLFGYIEDGALVGYGGLVHVVWKDLHAEVSFLTETGRASGQKLRDDWFAYLDMLTELARDELGLQQLTTETFATRVDTPPILEEYGFAFVCERTAQSLVDGSSCSSLVHTLNVT